MMTTKSFWSILALWSVQLLDNFLNEPISQKIVSWLDLFRPTFRTNPICFSRNKIWKTFMTKIVPTILSHSDRRFKYVLFMLTVWRSRILKKWVFQTKFFIWELPARNLSIMSKLNHRHSFLYWKIKFLMDQFLRTNIPFAVKNLRVWSA